MFFNSSKIFLVSTSFQLLLYLLLKNIYCFRKIFYCYINLYNTGCVGGFPGAGGGAGHEGREGDRGGQLRPRRQRVRPVQGECAPASLAVPEGKTTFLHLSFCIDSTAFVNKNIFSILYMTIQYASKSNLSFLHFLVVVN